jgi:hypothetical protein
MVSLYVCFVNAVSSMFLCPFLTMCVLWFLHSRLFVLLLQSVCVLVIKLCVRETSKEVLHECVTIIMFHISASSFAHHLSPLCVKKVGFDGRFVGFCCAAT